MAAGCRSFAKAWIHTICGRMRDLDLTSSEGAGPCVAACGATRDHECTLGPPPCSQVESGALVAAGAVVPPGTVVPKGTVWAGNPARQLRELSSEEQGFIGASAANYAELANEHKCGWGGWCRGRACCLCVRAGVRACACVRQLMCLRREGRCRC